LNTGRPTLMYTPGSGETSPQTPFRSHSANASPVKVVLSWYCEQHITLYGGDGVGGGEGVTANGMQITLVE